MNPLWTTVIAVLAFILIVRMKSRGRKPRAPSLYRPKIGGFQVNTFIHPRISGACLHDNGVQFGRGFRRKEGPALPHNGECRCEIAAFSYTSSEVFNGALRNISSIRSTIAGLELTSARQLIEELKRLEHETLPGALEEYMKQVKLELFPGNLQAELHGFFGQRYNFLAGIDESKDRAAGDDNNTESHKTLDPI